jgi:cathepsin L
VAAVEGIHQITTQNLVSLSEQQLLDCSTGSNNRGCHRGDMDEAFRHIVHSGGITSEEAYPYFAHQGHCRSSGEQAAAKISGFQYVPPGNETALLLAVAHQPVSITLDGKNPAFRHFGGGGIFGAAGEQCTTDLNHAVTAVGYGTDQNGAKYWLMKNSWGSTWADQGYVKIARDVASTTGLCGLAMQASYPVA